MRFNSKIKIREEDGFYLLINLDSNSIMKGKPSFFKINEEAKIMLDIIKNNSFGNYAELREVLYINSPYDIDDIEKFIDILVEMDVII